MNHTGEYAMTRMEAAAWPLACGGGCVFAIAVVLSGAPRVTIVAALAAAVAAWSLRAPTIAGVLLGGMAWLFLTGFDVNAGGALRFTGWPDLVRLSVLVAAGLAGVATGRFLARERSFDLMPGDPKEESRDDRSGIHPADSGDLRPARPDREGGGAAVTAQRTRRVSDQ